MHRTRVPRAAWPLLAAVLGVALAADATWATATSARPTATSPQQAEVEALTSADSQLAGWAPAPDAPAAPFTDPEDAFGWRSGWSPTVVVTPSEAAVAPAPKATTTTTAPTVWWRKYSGTNHVWMPTLGVSKHVYLFPCSRSTDPDNLVYRWGCAGTNNVYLLGHAYGVFKALHDAYANGKLRKGMPVVYADANGRERLYRVTTWKVVSPLDAGWAMASQPVRSMTLQTCVGPNGSLRLVVRLVVAKR